MFIRRKCKLPIKIISCVVIATFLTCDIARAYPTPSRPQSNTLAQRTIFTNSNRAGSFEMVVAKYITEEMNKRFSVASLPMVKKRLKCIKEIASELKVGKENFKIIDESGKGQVLVFTSQRYCLRFFNPNIADLSLPKNFNPVPNLEYILNSYLSFQVLEKKISNEKFKYRSSRLEKLSAKKEKFTEKIYTELFELDWPELGPIQVIGFDGSSLKKYKKQRSGSSGNLLHMVTEYERRSERMLSEGLVEKEEDIYLYAVLMKGQIAAYQFAYTPKVVEGAGAKERYLISDENYLIINFKEMGEQADEILVLLHLLLCAQAVKKGVAKYRTIAKKDNVKYLALCRKLGIIKNGSNFNLGLDSSKIWQKREGSTSDIVEKAAKKLKKKFDNKELPEELQRIVSESDTEKPKLSSGSPYSIFAILQGDFNERFVNVEEIRQKTEGGMSDGYLSKNTVERDLGTLVFLGLVEKEGKGEEVKYKVKNLSHPEIDIAKTVLESLGSRPTSDQKRSAKRKLAIDLKAHELYKKIKIVGCGITGLSSAQARFIKLLFSGEDNISGPLPKRDIAHFLAYIEVLYGWDLIDSVTAKDELDGGKISELDNKITDLYSDRFKGMAEQHESLRIHVKYCKYLVKNMAKRCGYSERTIKWLDIAADAHDLGKVIDAEALALHYSQKTRKEMTPRERGKIYEHTKDSLLVLQQQNLKLPYEAILTIAINHASDFSDLFKKINHDLEMKINLFKVVDRFAALTEKQRKYKRNVELKNKKDILSWVKKGAGSSSELIEGHQTESILPILETIIYHSGNSVLEIYKIIIEHSDKFDEDWVSTVQFRRILTEFSEKNIPSVNKLILELDILADLRVLDKKGGASPGRPGGLSPNYRLNELYQGLDHGESSELLFILKILQQDPSAAEIEKAIAEEVEDLSDSILTELLIWNHGTVHADGTENTLPELLNVPWSGGRTIEIYKNIQKALQKLPENIGDAERESVLRRFILAVIVSTLRKDHPMITSPVSMKTLSEIFVFSEASHETWAHIIDHMEVFGSIVDQKEIAGEMLNLLKKMKSSLADEEGADLKAINSIIRRVFVLRKKEKDRQAAKKISKPKKKKSKKSLKAPGSLFLDEDKRVDKDYIAGLLKNSTDRTDEADVAGAVKYINDHAPPFNSDGINRERTEIRIYTVNNLENENGIPRFPGIKATADFIYAYGAFDQEEEDKGTLNIYVTKGYFKTYLLKGTERNMLALAEFIDHEYSENVLGYSHRAAASRSYLFASGENALSPFHIDYIRQLAGYGDFLAIDALKKEDRAMSEDVKELYDNNSAIIEKIRSYEKNFSDKLSNIVSFVPPLFLDLKADSMKSMEEKEREAVNEVCQKLKNEPETIILRDGNLIYDFINNIIPTVGIYVVDGNKLEEGLAKKGQPRIAEGFVTYTEKGSSSAKGQSGVSNIFIPSDIYKIMLSFWKEEVKGPRSASGVKQWITQEVMYLAKNGQVFVTKKDFKFAEDAMKVVLLLSKIERMLEAGKSQKAIEYIGQTIETTDATLLTKAYSHTLRGRAHDLEQKLDLAYMDHTTALKIMNLRQGRIVMGHPLEKKALGALIKWQDSDVSVDDYIMKGIDVFKDFNTEILKIKENEQAWASLYFGVLPVIFTRIKGLFSEENPKITPSVRVIIKKLLELAESGKLRNRLDGAGDASVLSHIYSLAGELDLLDKKFDQAIEKFKKAIRHDKTFPAPYTGLIFSYMGKTETPKSLDLAYKVLFDAEKECGSSPILDQTRTFLQLCEGRINNDIKESESMYKEVSRLFRNGKYDRAVQRIATGYNKKKIPDNLENLKNKAKALAKLKTRGMDAYNRGDHKKAKECFEEILSDDNNPLDSDLRSLLDYVKLMLREKEKEEEEKREAEDYLRNNVEELLGVASYQRVRGKIKEAKKNYRNILEALGRAPFKHELIEGAKIAIGRKLDAIKDKADRVDQRELQKNGKNKKKKSATLMSEISEVLKSDLDKKTLGDNKRKVFFSENVTELLKSQNAPRKKLLNMIGKLESDPKEHIQGIRPIAGSSGLWRLKVSEYRFIYVVFEKNKVLILEGAQKKDVDYSSLSKKYTKIYDYDTILDSSKTLREAREEILADKKGALKAPCSRDLSAKADKFIRGLIGRIPARPVENTRISEAVKYIRDHAPPLSGRDDEIDLSDMDIEVHVLDLGEKLGIPRNSVANASENPASSDLVYAYPIYDSENEYLQIYMTKKYFETQLSGKYGNIALAEIIDHEYTENVLDKPHRVAASRARLFVPEGKLLSPFHSFYIDQVMSKENGHKFLKGLVEHRDASDIVSRFYADGPKASAEIKRYERLFKHVAFLKWFNNIENMGEDERLNVLIKEFRSMLYLSQSDSMEIINLIEEIEISKGIKRKENYFTVEYGDARYPIHPYYLPVEGVKPVVSLDTGLRALRKLIKEKEGGKRPVVVRITGRVGSGKTNLANQIGGLGVADIKADEILVINVDEYLKEGVMPRRVDIDKVKRKISAAGEKRLIIVEGAKSRQVFVGVEKIFDKEDILVFIKNTNKKVCWEKIAERDYNPEHLGKPKELLEWALGRNIYYRYGLDLKERDADIVIDVIKGVSDALGDNWDIETIEENAKSVIPCLTQGLMELSAKPVEEEKGDKVMLYLDEDLAGLKKGDVENALKDLIVMFADLKNNNKTDDNNDSVGDFLRNLEILRGTGKEFSRKGTSIKPENTIVVTTKFNRDNDCFKDVINGQGVVAALDVYDGFQETNDYLPVLETVFFAVGKYLNWEEAVLRECYKNIPNAVSIEEADDKIFEGDMKDVVIRLIPSATRLDEKELVEMMTRIKTILRQA